MVEPKNSRLTKKLVEAAIPQKSDIYIWDAEIKGLGCKIAPSGRRTYVLLYRTRDGRQRKPTLGQHGLLTCEQARQTARQLLSEVAQGADPSGERERLRKMMTLHQLANCLTKDHDDKYKPKTKELDAVLWNHHILPRLGNHKITSITKRDVIDLHVALAAIPTTANRSVSLIGRAYRYAQHLELLDDGINPAQGVRRYTERRRERFLSVEDMTRLNSVLDDVERRRTELPSVPLVIRLLLHTGCRLSEILTLRGEYIDLANRFIRLPDSKTGAKTIYLSNAARQLLANAETTGYVAVGKIDGTHLVNIQKPWRRIRKAAALEDVRLHDLRHNFASVGAANGLSLQMIGALLGHKDIRTTQRYAHLFGNDLKDAATKIGAHIESNSHPKA